MQFSSLLVAALAGAASAVDVQVVSVGKSATNTTGLKYWPSSIKAAAGTMVQFQFWVGNHTVTQSNFDNPCVPINNVNASIEGFYSGFMPVAASADKSMIPTYTITIKDDKPVWIYCSQGKHCQGGMSMVINENTSANASRSLENYQSSAQSVADSNLVPDDSSSGGDNNNSGDNNNNSGNDGAATTTAGSGSGSGSATSTPTGAASSTETAVTGAGSTFAAPTTALLAMVAVFALL